MDDAHDNRHAGVPVPPSLLGRGPGAGDEMKILSLLQAPPARRRAGSAPRWLMVGDAVAGLSWGGWWLATSAGGSAFSVAAVQQATAATRISPPEQPASASALAPAVVPGQATAARIETLPAARAASAAGPRDEPAALTPTASAPAATGSEPATSQAIAAVQAAADMSPRAMSKPRRHAGSEVKETNKASGNAPAKAAARDPDVTLLEAMVAHVRGQSAAAPAKAPAAPSGTDTPADRR